VNDRSSQYRCARLILFPPHLDGGHAPWSLTAEVIRKGVPRSQMLDHGHLLFVAREPSVEALWEAFWEVADERLGRGRR